MDPRAKRYQVIVKLDSSDLKRVSNLVPRLNSELSRIAQGPIELVFRSATADLFGYFVCSTLSASKILATMQTPARDPFLDGKDSLFVFEVGDDFSAAAGFSRSATWLQRH